MERFFLFQHPMIVIFYPQLLKPNQTKILPFPDSYRG
jgi:hypothetical protein